MRYHACAYCLFPLNGNDSSAMTLIHGPAFVPFSQNAAAAQQRSQRLRTFRGNDNEAKDMLKRDPFFGKSRLYRTVPARPWPFANLGRLLTRHPR